MYPEHMLLSFNGRFHFSLLSQTPFQILTRRQGNAIRNHKSSSIHLQLLWLRNMVLFCFVYACGYRLVVFLAAGDQGAYD
jgi:hypothetical protein